MEEIYKQNVAELQKQLQDSYKHIAELNAVKDAAKNVVLAHDELHAFAHYNTTLQVNVDNAIWRLKKTL